MAEAARIAEYYDRNSGRFLRAGGYGAALAMHRRLWPAGVTDAAVAADYVNRLVARTVARHLARAPAQVLDLGCGVGGTLLHLARRWPGASGLGLTLSEAQVARAQTAATRRPEGARVRFERADFLAPRAPALADLVLAVESHVHAPSVGAFLDAAARHVAPAGLLVVVDDVLARPETALSATERRWVEAFRRGWRLGHVPTTEALARAGAARGLALVETQDLTHLLRLDQPIDRALRLLGPLADRAGLAHLPRFANMIGGNALNACYRPGLMSYRLHAFAR